MTAARTKNKEKTALREDILDAARELFVSQGYENVSMRKIAERIGYSPTTIYLYFKDKSELLREICETTFAKLGDEIIESQHAGGSTIDILRRGMIAYIEFGLSNPHHYDVVFISPGEKFIGPNDFSYEGSMGQQAFDLMASSVTDCMAAGTIRDGDVATIAQTLWAGIHGATSLLITHEGFPWVDRKKLTDSVVDTLIAGITVPNGL